MSFFIDIIVSCFFAYRYTFPPDLDALCKNADFPQFAQQSWNCNLVSSLLFYTESDVSRLVDVTSLNNVYFTCSQYDVFLISNRPQWNAPLTIYTSVYTCSTRWSVLNATQVDA
jgi:hypothetical protein